MREVWDNIFERSREYVSTARINAQRRRQNRRLITPSPPRLLLTNHPVPVCLETLSNVAIIMRVITPRSIHHHGCQVQVRTDPRHAQFFLHLPPHHRDLPPPMLHLIHHEAERSAVKMTQYFLQSVMRLGGGVDPLYSSPPPGASVGGEYDLLNELVIGAWCFISPCDRIFGVCHPHRIERGVDHHRDDRFPPFPPSPPLFGRRRSDRSSSS